MPRASQPLLVCRRCRLSAFRLRHWLQEQAFWGWPSVLHPPNGRGCDFRAVRSDRECFSKTRVTRNRTGPGSCGSYRSLEYFQAYSIPPKIHSRPNGASPCQASAISLALVWTCNRAALRGCCLHFLTSSTSRLSHDEEYADVERDLRCSSGTTHKIDASLYFISVFPHFDVILLPAACLRGALHWADGYETDHCAARFG